MHESYSFWFDRKQGTIEGALTLQRAIDSTRGLQVQKVFDRIKARSGQRRYSDIEGVRGKSPIPYGSFWLTTKKEPLQMEPKGTPFYGIGNKQGSNSIGYRLDIGLHLENGLVGSAGCVVIVDRDIAKKLFSVLDDLHARGIEYIPFNVI